MARKALCLMAAIWVAPLGAADYLMGGYDAQRTGNSPAAAPAWGDVAYHIRLPGTAAYLTGPLVVDGRAFVLTTGGENRETSGLWAIDLDTGDKGLGPIVQIARTHPLFDNPAYASDGNRILMVRTGWAEMYDLDGTLLGAIPLDSMLAGTETTWLCLNPAWEGTNAYFPCNEVGFQNRPDDGRKVISGAVSFIVAVNTEAFTADIWLMEAAFQAAQSRDGARPSLPVQRFCRPPVDETCPQVQVEIIYGVTVGKDQITASVAIGGHYSAIDPTDDTIPQGSGYTDQRIISFDRFTGDVKWAHPLNIDGQPNDVGTIPNPGERDTVGVVPSPLHLYNENVVSFVFEDVIHRNAEDGSEARDETFLGTGDPNGRDFGGVLAYNGDRFYTATHRVVRSFDGQWGDEASKSLPGSGTMGNSPMMIADGTIFVQSDEGTHTEIGTTGIGTQGRVLANKTSVNAFNADPLEHLWTVTVPVKMDIPLSASSFAVSDGLVVHVTRDGLVTVIGETSASVTARPEASTTYPPVGDEVSVDLSASGPGIHGPPTRYGANWDGGSVDTWSATPILRHAYNTRGEHVARFAVMNEAGQTASTTVTFHVGEPAPRDPNPLAGFIANYADAAWGIFGLVVVLVGAAFTSYKIAQRRGLMRRELAAIDATPDEVGTSTTRLRAGMEERRARAHGLLIDRRIDESQYQILGRRIDEATRGSRMHQLHELFGFLPHAMVRAIEQMLEDGQIGAVENRGIQAMLNENEVLTRAQKAKLGALVDDWFAQDNQQS